MLCECVLWIFGWVWLVFFLQGFCGVQAPGFVRFVRVACCGCFAAGWCVRFNARPTRARIEFWGLGALVCGLARFYKGCVVGSGLG